MAGNKANTTNIPNDLTPEELAAEMQAELAFELAANFEPGEVVIDVTTGESTVVPNFTPSNPRLQDRVPFNWSMYTTKGNIRLEKLARKFARRMVELIDSGEMTEGKVKLLLVNYLAQWIRLGRSKSYAEASDTAVREVVGRWFDTMASETGIWWSGDLYDLWTTLLDRAYRQVS